MGTHVIKEAKLVSILGSKSVEAIEIEKNGARKMIDCDAVVLTGKFRSESALYANGFLERDNHAPLVTEKFKTSRAGIFAVGNVLGHLQTAGACMTQGRELAAMLTS